MRERLAICHALKNSGHTLAPIHLWFSLPL